MANLSIPNLKLLLEQEKPLQLVGTINAYVARLAKEVGFKAIYLSGGGVSAGDLGVPDLALTSLDDVLTQVRRITSCVDLPLVVDADTGWGSPLNISRTFYEINKAGASAAHIEDQNIEKRCGHREGKRLVSKEMMVARIKAALNGRRDDDFMVIARTDAIALEGVEHALDRAVAYEEAGADAIFVEAAEDLATYQMFSSHLKIPILANLTEFGKTPLFSLDELNKSGVSIALYPLSAFRAMNYAALQTLKAIRHEGSQESMLASMQSREELYKVLNYDAYEKALDEYLYRGEGHE